MYDQVTHKTDGSPQELDFDQPVINIGSHPDNDINLSGPGVLPFHAMVVLEDGGYNLVPLTPEADIRLDGVFIEDSAITISENQRIEIGEFMLIFRQDGSPTNVRVSVMQPGAAASTLQEDYDFNGGENAILVNILSEQAEVEVEQSAFFELEVINAGPIVAGFYVDLEGLPADWVDINNGIFNLNEGQRIRTTIRITPPRKPTSSAGIHDFTIRVSSPNYPGHDVVSPFMLDILPYYHFKLGNLSPRQQRIRWRKRSGKAKLPISNLGNSSTDFNISALDDENGCSFDFQVSDELELTRQAAVSIPAGETLDLPIKITPLKQRLFAMRGKRYHYTTTVQVPQQAALSQTISGMVTSLPLFGWWIILLGLVAIALGIFLLVQPRIQFFRLAAGKDVIELGDTTKLEWSVSPFATRVSISNLDEPITRGQKSMTIAPEKSTTYELVSGNWLSGMVGIDRRETQTVLVVPPSPEIGVFEVDSTAVDKGAPVNIRWSVTQAEQVFLTVDEVVFELSSEEFSGEQTYILEKDALVTLEAVNASGSELRSYFVNVVPPRIDINTFTVWVKSQDAAANLPNPTANAGGLKLAAPAYEPADDPPDPNFPEAYVMLVPDKASDNGYRVEFLQPDRELAKGEQVMLEWNVFGVETVQIAPFPEELPSSGLQPFFPQESMNFVMSAQSGELEKLFMLPVKVYDGLPPEAPTIEFFQGAPAKMTGGGPVEFAWSVSGEWTRVQLSGGEAVLADYLNPQGFKTVNVAESGTFILTAWNGEDLSSAAPFDITVDPALISVTLNITGVYPTTGRFMVGDKATVSIAFGDIPEGQPDPSGEVIVSDGFSICPIALPALSCELTFDTPGDPKEITASYEGDDIYLQASSDPYSGTITVSSAKAELLADYYYLDKDTNDVGVFIPKVSDQPLELDEGLFITVTVKPLSTNLPDDEEGTVSVSLCEQEGEEEEITPGTCEFVATNSVDVVDGMGYTTIRLPDLGDANDGQPHIVILFEYRHGKNALDPASLSQFGIDIAKLRIFLSLDVCDDPKSFSGCVMGVADRDDVAVTFDIMNEGDPDTEDDDAALSTSLPEPLSENFEVFETPPDPDEVWDCDVVVVGDKNRVYKLECTPQSDLHDTKVNFDFDNASSENYYMGADPATDFNRSEFDLDIKDKTKLAIETLDLTNIKVGEVITLTSVNTATNVIQLTGYGYEVNSNANLTLTSSAGEIFALDTGCDDLSNGVVEMGSNKTLCRVYFDEKGDFPLSAGFIGDQNYYPSSAEVEELTVGTQNEITTTWMYTTTNPTQASDYANWNLTSVQPKQDLYVRVILGRPDGLSDSVLKGDNLTVKLTITNNDGKGVCGVDAGEKVGGTDSLDYPVVMTTDSDELVADFKVNCDKDGMEITLDIAFEDSENYALDADQDTSQNLVISDRGTVSMSVEVVRVADSDATLTNGGAYQLQRLFIGEEYEFTADVGVLWADGNKNHSGRSSTIQESINYYIDNSVVVVNLQGLEAGIDWTNSDCGKDASGNPEIPLQDYRVVRDFNYDPAGPGIHDIDILTLASDPCKLVFNTKKSAPASAGDFSFNEDDPYHTNRTYDAKFTFQPNDIDKQDITMELSPALDGKARVGSAAQDSTLTLNREVGGNSVLWPLDPNSDTFSAKFGVVDPCPGLDILDGTITGENTVDVTLTPPSSSSDCSSGELEIEYRGNDYFKTSTIKIEIDFAYAAATTTTLTINPSPSIYGSEITLQAKVESDEGTPVGDVAFEETTSSTSLGTATLNAAGEAEIKISNLSGGAHKIKAIYTSSSSDDFEDSESDEKDHTVNAATTTTSITSGGSPSLTGDWVTFEATVSATDTTPVGKVQFTKDGVDEGNPVSLSNGTANKTIKFTTAGTFEITAEFIPTNSNNYQTSDEKVDQLVEKETSTSVTSNDDETTYGEAVTFTAYVTREASGSGRPTGTVQFKADGQNLGAATSLTNASGNQSKASLTTSALAKGDHKITAVYIPTNNFAASTSPELDHEVLAAETEITIQVTPQPTATVGSTVYMTATISVKSPGGGTPTGKVQFKENGNKLGPQIDLDANGIATHDTDTLPLGDHEITARYTSNSANFKNNYDESEKKTIKIE